MYFECPVCKVISSGEDWNKSTQKKWNKDKPVIAPIENFFLDEETPFMTPCCKNKVYGGDITLVEKHFEVTRIN